MMADGVQTLACGRRNPLKRELQRTEYAAPVCHAVAGGEGGRFLGLWFYKNVAPTALGSGRRRANGFNAKSPRGKDAKEKSECFAASRLCAFALKIFRLEYAAPTGLEIFRFVVLKRCRADGAGETNYFPDSSTKVTLKRSESITSGRDSFSTSSERTAFMLSSNVRLQ